MILQESIYPLRGPLIEFQLTIDWILLFFFVQWALIFWVKLYNEKRKLISPQERAFIGLFFGNAFMWLFSIIGDYFASTTNLRFLHMAIGYLAFMIGGLYFILSIERDTIFFKKYLFTTIFSILISVYGILFLSAIEYITIIRYFYWPLFFVVFTMYIRNLGKKSPTQKIYKNFRFQRYKFYIGFIFLAAGYAFTTEDLLVALGTEYRLLADLFLLIGLIFISLFFISMPSMVEYEWQQKIDGIYLSLKSGLCIYNKDLTSSEDTIDWAIASSSLAVAKIWLKELTETDEVYTIEKKGKTVIIFPGKFIIGVLICREKLKSLQNLLTFFVERIEGIYYHIFENFTGDLSVFEPIDGIVKEFFLI